MTLYHHSPKRNRAFIRKHGLKAKKARTVGEAVYLTDVPEYSDDTWAVDVRGIDVEEDFVQPEDPKETWYVTYQDIAPSRLRLLAPKRTLVRNGS